MIKLQLLNADIIYVCVCVCVCLEYMIFWPPIHGILTPYPWYIELSTNGILSTLSIVFWTPYPWFMTPLSMVFWPPYPWYIEPSTNYILTPPTHGILNPPNHGISNPYRWYIEPPTHEITSASVIFRTKQTINRIIMLIP
jgi:hypothetical protein